MKESTSTIIFLLFPILILYSQQKDIAQVKGPYLGQNPPGKTPQLFAPGIISTDNSEGCSGWGNEMEYFIFQRWIDGKSRLYIMNQINGIWSEPVLLPFVDTYQVGDFTIAPDGKTMVFASNIVIEAIGSEGEGGNIWIVEKVESGWSEPKHIGTPINTKYHDSYPCLSANRNLYFFSRKPGGFGQSDLYMSKYIDGQYQTPLNLGNSLNTEYHEWDTYISPDERFMIYCSMMPGGLGSDDLYITFKIKNGSWSKPAHMGNEINSEKSENRPYVSPDGNYFFYTSTKRGHRDIYWVDANILNDFRPK
jgi:Tol biopolymer transport system component